MASELAVPQKTRPSATVGEENLTAVPRASRLLGASSEE
jgi:hypothetical protein